MGEELGSTELQVDVLIVGAGISGIGAAYHLQQQCPSKTFLIVDTLESFGGTWLTHRYPGIRSDSDLYTFGYRFKPWVGPPIATAEEILAYMGEVIDENGIAPHIRYRHKVLKASWSNETCSWTVAVRDLEKNETLTVKAKFLWMCQGYYRHDKGHTPQWKGMSSFKGQVVHPQTWPENLDVTDKNVLIIGSGATAATLAPALAPMCKHVTVLQRSPTYFIPGRNANDLADTLRQLEVDEAWIHEIVRRKILFDQEIFTRRSFEDAEGLTQELLEGVKAFVGPEEVTANFTPRYRPWRQRIAFVPDGDLFQGITSGKASVVTDEIEAFNETGIMLRSGRQLNADIIVTATGFDISVLGDIAFDVDGQPIDFAKTVTYRGMMFTGVPNLVWVFGYFRASWTLRVDLVSDVVCRLLNHMDRTGARKVVPELRPEDADMEILPWIDPENFNPGYLLRAMDRMPRRGAKAEWQHTQDYWRERKELPALDLTDAALHYG